MPESRKRKKDARPVESDDELRPSWTEGIKHSPRWYAPLAFTLMGLGLLWIVLFYALTLSGIALPLGNWNLAIGFGVIIFGFGMLMWWR